MTFDELAHSMRVEGFEESPSELHGILAGRIAGGERLPPEGIGSALVECLAIEQELVDNARDDLIKLYASIIKSFEDDSFGFQPLLPGDDMALADRVRALSEWCESFLSGLGEASGQSSLSYSQEAVDTIRDMAAIAQVGYEDEDGEEDDEADFAELMEYVRMAAIMLFTEFNFSSSAATPGTIH
jgi:uncharacterized protein